MQDVQDKFEQYGSIVEGSRSGHPRLTQTEGNETCVYLSNNLEPSKINQNICF